MGDSMTKVTELLALKIENLSLKLGQLQDQHERLHADRAVLIEEARKEVNAPTGHVYNVETRQFQAHAGPVPFRAPTAREKKRVKA